MQENPYYDRTSVRDLDRLFGRREILQAIFAACKQRQCFSLIGTRKVGKSSVLKHIQSVKLQKDLGVDKDLQRHIFIYIDMHSYLHQTLDHFFQDLSTQIAEHAPKHVVLSTADYKKHEIFRRNLQELHKAGYHLVLSMDAFDTVEDERQFGSDFFSFLRAPSAEGSVSYITASRKPLYRISPIEAASSPFFDNFKTEYMGALGKDEALQLINRPALQAGLPFDEADIAWISDSAGGHPFFIQMTCHGLFEEKVRQARDGLVIDYQRASQSIYAELLPLFNHIWSELSPEQQRGLKQETSGVLGTPQKLDELSEGALFQRYVQDMRKQVYGGFHLGQPGITVKDVKEALTRLDDRAFLQTSPLAELCSDDVQNEEVKITANRKGQLLQDLLRKAFEKMKPEGTRTDLAPEWRLYNTIYYGYFTRGFTNEQAATRLGISLRQFYRDRDRAIQAFIQELL